MAGPRIAWYMYTRLMISTRQLVCMNRKKHGLQWAPSMGVATMANKKTLLVKLMGHTKRFEAQFRNFFTDFNFLFMLTSCLDAYMLI